MAGRDRGLGHARRGDPSFGECRYRHPAVSGAVTHSSYVFAPDEQPTFPGSPYAPRHPAARKAGYMGIAMLSALGATFGNNLVTVNVQPLSGSLGVYVAQASLLPAIYVAMNATANLSLVKARMQFGIPAITHGLVALYAASALLQLLWPGFATAVINRGMCGLAAAALTTFTVYNLLQVFQGKLRPLAPLLGVSLPQLGMPLARMVPVELLALGEWRGLHLLELGLALAVLGASFALPLPPSERSKAIGPLDLLTVALVVPAMLLICAVLGVGRVVWWHDTPWLGVALACAIPLLGAAFLIEHHREKPLILTRWIGTPEILRFAGIALLVRLALAEQSYGAVGLLTAGGLTNDQLHALFAVVALAMIAGMVVAVVTLNPARIPHQVCAASLIIAAGAWLDSQSTSLTRPPELFLSQALIGFGTLLFIGPAFLYGFSRMMLKGPDALVTCIVLFSTTQNVGGLAGSALLGSLQQIGVRHNSAILAGQLDAANPIVADRLRAGSAAVAGAIGDPAQRSAQGAALLGQAMTREANILAFNSVFLFVTALALATALYLLFLIVRRRLRERQGE